MASKAVVVDDLARELDVTTPTALDEIEQTVGDITLDLLSQNDGQFKGLQVYTDIVVTVGNTAYLLPADFNTALETFYEMNSDGEYVGEVDVISKEEMFRRKSDNAYAGRKLSYIEFRYNGSSGRGWYLVLGAEPSETATYRFDYYRQATSDDTDIIRNVEILKTGCRGKLTKYNQNAQQDRVIYLRMREGFRENPQKTVTKSIMTPSRPTGLHNRLMNKIGRGR